MNTPLSIAVESPRAAGVAALLEGSSTYAQSLYPPESNFLLDISQLEQPGVLVYIARDTDGRALGMAALVEHESLGDARAELKRMFVDPDARGFGVASALINNIETDAATRGLREIVLETGPLHHPALALYAKHGYRRIERFGQYVGEPFSVCMAKSLVGFLVEPVDEEGLTAVNAD